MRFTQTRESANILTDNLQNSSASGEDSDSAFGSES